MKRASHGFRRHRSDAFDPAQCPLLAGLSPEEQADEMLNNPLIRACVSKVEAGETMPSDCSAHLAMMGDGKGGLNAK